MSAATQIASRKFDAKLFVLPTGIQERIQSKIDAMGERLPKFTAGKKLTWQ